MIGTFVTTLSSQVLTTSLTPVANALAPFVPAGATMIVNAEGDVSLTANTTNQAVVEARLFVDGTLVRFIRTWAMNSNFLTGMIANWHLTFVGTFATDKTRDVHVEMRIVNATGGAPTANAVPGHLSVVLLK